MIPTPLQTVAMTHRETFARAGTPMPTHRMSGRAALIVVDRLVFLAGPKIAVAVADDIEVGVMPPDAAHRGIHHRLGGAEQIERHAALLRGLGNVVEQIRRGDALGERRFSTAAATRTPAACRRRE